MNGRMHYSTPYLDVSRANLPTRSILLVIIPLLNSQMIQLTRKRTIIQTSHPSMHMYIRINHPMRSRHALGRDRAILCAVNVRSREESVSFLFPSSEIRFRGHTVSSRRISKYSRWCHHRYHRLDEQTGSTAE
jgi:hypothetical protein